MQPGYAAARPVSSNVSVSSSATRKIGLPPVEMDSAWARLACAPSVAAQVFRASRDGKWIFRDAVEGRHPMR
jgi:hypothetical protein